MTVSPSSIDISFIKGQNFRVIHVDGVYGGLSPHGYIHTTIYSERPAVPRKSRVSVSNNGEFLGEEVVETIGGVVRELEADIVMNFTSAVSFYFWLEQKIDALRKAIGMTDEAWKEIMKKQASAQMKTEG